MNRPKKKVSWEQAGFAASSLAEKVDPTKFDYVYGVPRGGVVLAAMIARMVGKPLSLQLFSPSHPLVPLVVDDISDTGATIAAIATERRCVTATWFYREGTVLMPDWTYESAFDYWILFPWELYDKENG